MHNSAMGDDGPNRKTIMSTHRAHECSDDVWLGRQGDAEARAREIANARENWPDATWGPFDDPPVGVRVRLPVSLSLGRDGDVVTVVGLFQNDPSAWPRPHDCPSCTCKRVAPPCVGWWAVRREGGFPIPVYPPCVTPVLPIVVDATVAAGRSAEEPLLTCLLDTTTKDSVPEPEPGE